MKIFVFVTMIGLLSVSCSSDMSKGKKGRIGELNISNFKNTEDLAGFNKKAAKAKKIVTKTENLKETTIASGSGNGLIAFRRTNMALARKSKNEKCKYRYAGTEAREIEGKTVLVETHKCSYKDEENELILCKKEIYKNARGKNIEEQSCVSAKDAGSEIYEFGYLGDFFPAFEDPSNCQTAFQVFDKLYAELKVRLDDLVSAVNNQGSLGLNAPENDLKLTEQEPDDRSAVSYKYENAAENQSVTIEGNLSAGANDKMILIRQDYSLTIDFSDIDAFTPPAEEPTSLLRVNQNQYIAADLEAQMIELNTQGQLLYGERDHKSAMDLSGYVVISNGERKYVKQNFSVSQAVGTEKNSSHIKVKAELVSLDQLKLTANMSGSMGNGTYEFTIVKDENNQCKVKDIVNTIN